MTARLLLAVLLAAVAGPSARAADEPEQKPTARELLRARVTEDAKKKPAAPARKGSAASSTAASTVTAASPAAAATTPAPTVVLEPTAKAGVAKEAATVLPKMEVKKGRITVLDQQLAKQEEDIARERKNLTTSETDLALNDSKIAQPLAIFGGESAQFRKRVASERVQLMEAEKDLIQAIAFAKTKAEKAELQKQLDDIRAFRRELDKTLR